MGLSACGSNSTPASSPNGNVSLSYLLYGQGKGVTKSNALSKVIAALQRLASHPDTGVSFTETQHVASTTVSVDGNGYFSFSSDSAKVSITFQAAGKSPYSIEALYLPDSMYLQFPAGGLPNGMSWLVTKYTNGTASKPGAPWIVTTAVALDPMGFLDTIGNGAVSATKESAANAYSVAVNLGDSYSNTKGYGSNDVRVALSNYINSGLSNQLHIKVYLSETTGVSKISEPITGGNLDFFFTNRTATTNFAPPSSSSIVRLSSIPVGNGEGAGGDSDGDG